MQCNQPIYGGPYYNCTPPIQCGGRYPEIIGEGDVTSLTLPDGTVQFLFTPSVKWWEPYQFQPSIANFNSKGPLNCSGPYQNANTRAWFIRSITNPIPATGYNPQNQRYEVPRQFQVSDCNINGFQIKFHNDQDTSTTDIHYFYPNLRRYGYYARTTMASAAVQVEIPVNDTTYRYNVVRAKPCRCAVHCDSKMSIVENNSKEYLSKESDEHKCKCSLKKHKRTKSNNVICECDKPTKACADKSVTTYADKASNCAPSCVTQTSCEEAFPVGQVKNVKNRSNIQSELWQLKRRKNAKKNSSTRITGQSTSCSSNCSCPSDTD